MPSADRVEVRDDPGHEGLTPLRRSGSVRPFFSICVPQHNRTSFLLELCKSLVRQSSRDFEVCISDDHSTDGRQHEIVDFLKTHDVPYVYRTQKTNRRYDANLRTAIALSSGSYCLLMGNDDVLADDCVLEELHAALCAHQPVAVALVNYQQWPNGRVFARFRATGVRPGTPALAASVFRNFSFVSGVVIDAELAKRYATVRWDGSEMYQMYLATRIIAGGGRVLEFDRIAVLKDVQIAGESVESYASRTEKPRWRVVKQTLPLAQIPSLVADAIKPMTAPSEWQRLAERIAARFLLFTYPYWLFEYRRVRSWNYSAGVSLGMTPRKILSGVPLTALARMRLRAVYLASTLCGLFVPTSMLGTLEPLLYRIAKAVQ